MIPAPPGSSIVVSLPAGAEGVDVPGVDWRSADFVGWGIGTEVGFATAGVGLDGTGVELREAEDDDVLIPLEDEVEVDGCKVTMICSPFVIGIVDICVSSTTVDGNDFGGYPKRTV
jgi:hypothetical protein